ncbi:MAG: hypothetical protein WDA41_09915 [Candidatus Neomarinimicrobiota bacterium]
MPTPAEELALKWWKENTCLRGGHTRGSYMHVRDYVDIALWAVEGGEPTEEEAVRLLTPIAQRYLDEKERA